MDTKSQGRSAKSLPRSAIRWAPAWLALAAWCWAAPATAAEVKAYRGQLEIPTYPWWPAVKHPYFRETDGRNIYPYPMLDQLSRAQAPRTYRTVVLENEYLRVTILPELGGKVHEVIEKNTGRPMFYVNHVIKPGLIGQCGAWTSGGIEWNTGPQGHTVGCMQPVEVLILPAAKDGSRSVAIGEVERIYQTRWTVVLTLRPGRTFLEESIRIYNQTETVRPYYFWNCTAMPNTPGFRFIYPMTLGSDHSGEHFYTWPVSDGKDLTRGTNYQDASSIFAWHCDQDFFGSYDDGAEHGVVAFANHDQVPGKKAWTWGQGSFGKMHQMDLTDADGPYNEVQTGPLLTQAQVGRLEPQEAVAWQEWWYPVHGIGGFTYANRDVAVNASREGSQLRLRLIGTGAWPRAKVLVNRKGEADTDRQRLVTEAVCRLSPLEPVDLKLDSGGPVGFCTVTILDGEHLLARFQVPLALPVRKPPEKPSAPKTAAELAQAGWQDFLFARLDEAESHFLKALEQDSQSISAHTGLAFLKLDGDPAAAAQAAEKALAVDDNCGLAHFALAVARGRLGDERLSLARRHGGALSDPIWEGRGVEAQWCLDEAWEASLDPATAVAGRALVGKCLIRAGDYKGAVQALSEPGPWQTDSGCRNRLALACWKRGDKKEAVHLARANLAIDPLDAFAQSVLWLADAEAKSPGLMDLLTQPQAVLELVAEYADLGQNEIALRLLERSGLTAPAAESKDPLALYWAAYLAHSAGRAPAAQQYAAAAAALPAEGVFPRRIEAVPALRWAVKQNPKDGKAALYLGHLLCSLGRTREARDRWTAAAQLGAEPTVALRALGMASLKLDKNPEQAAKFLAEAQAADPADAIVARDLAQVLCSQAEKAGADRQHELFLRARDALKAAFVNGKSRSDFVALLARAQNRLGDYEATARMLDEVRVTVWEGAHETHDLFEEAHLALGRAHLEAGRAAAALAEFDRALQYPENLATGRLEHAREAHIHYLRGNALAALGRQAAALQAWRQAADEPPSKDAAKEEARQKAKEALAKAAAEHK